MRKRTQPRIETSATEIEDGWMVELSDETVFEIYRTERGPGTYVTLSVYPMLDGERQPFSTLVLKPTEVVSRVWPVPSQPPEQTFDMIAAVDAELGDLVAKLDGAWWCVHSMEIDLDDDDGVTLNVKDPADTRRIPGELFTWGSLKKTTPLRLKRAVKPSESWWKNIELQPNERLVGPDELERHDVFATMPGLWTRVDTLLPAGDGGYVQLTAYPTEDYEGEAEGEMTLTIPLDTKVCIRQARWQKTASWEDHLGPNDKPLNWADLEAGMVIAVAPGQWVCVEKVLPRTFEGCGVAFSATPTADYVDGPFKGQEHVNFTIQDFAKDEPVYRRMPPVSSAWDGEPFEPDEFVARATDLERDDVFALKPGMWFRVGAISHEGTFYVQVTAYPTEEYEGPAEGETSVAIPVDTLLRIRRAVSEEEPQATAATLRDFTVAAAELAQKLVPLAFGYTHARRIDEETERRDRRRTRLYLSTYSEDGELMPPTDDAWRAATLRRVRHDKTGKLMVEVLWELGGQSSPRPPDLHNVEDINGS